QVRVQCGRTQVRPFCLEAQPLLRRCKHKQFLEVLVRSRGLEPPRVAPLAPQASASTNSATTAWGLDAPADGTARNGARCNKSTVPGQGRQAGGRCCQR